MHYRHIALVLILFHLAFQAVHAQSDESVTILQPDQVNCSGGYNDSFDARVLDAKLRPVPDAMVIITYDRGQSFGQQYFTTQPRQTDSNGIVHFNLINGGTNTREIDCSIVVNASCGGESNITTVYATDHGSPVDVFLPLYQIRFHVTDGLGGPLTNATVTIDNLGRTTDASGLAAFSLDAGTHDYLASYLDGSQAGQLDVSDDATVEAALLGHNVTLEVTDDFGNPLPATLFIFNKTFQLGNGTFGSVKTFGSNIPYRTEYKGIVLEGVIVPSQIPNVKVVYDLHAPVFGNIRSDVNGSRYRLIMPV